MVKNNFRNLQKIQFKFQVKDHGVETIKSMSPQCEAHVITLAMNITRCIRREMFFSCKDEAISSENCQSLVEFGRGW